jgi:predicted nucleic acid-binding protein
VIAVDTSVLIDLLGEDARADAAEACLRMALGSGPVVVCEVVVSEVTAGLGHGSEVMDALDEMGVHFSAIEQRSAVRAGEMQRKYKERCVRGRGAVTVAAHHSGLPGRGPRLASMHGLITRDESFFRDYFKGLKVITPQAA